MGFLGVYRAIYDYNPQGESELAINEGDILYVLEKSVEDDWWKAKKKASGDDDDEPTGLIPNNYVEEVRDIDIDWNSGQPIGFDYVPLLSKRWPVQAAIC